MLKIMTKKQWDKFNNEYIDLQLENADLKSDNLNYKDQVDFIVHNNEQLAESNTDLVFTIAKVENKLKDAKKEIRRLKTLCTKNKIDYKEESKECKKTKK